jgi:hypothetical protein
MEITIKFKESYGGGRRSRIEKDKIYFRVKDGKLVCVLCWKLQNKQTNHERVTLK